MRIEYLRNKLFSRRSFMLGAGKITLMGLLASRMYYLQITEGSKYQTMSDRNKIRLIPVPPIRGVVYDRNKNILALNKNNYRVLLTKDSSRKINEALDKVAEILNLDESQKEDLYSRANSQKRQNTIVLFENISWHDLSIIEVNLPDLPGVYVEVGQIRYYPYHVVCSHLIGYVGSISKEELESASYTIHPDYKVGKNGIEKYFDERLQGIGGYKEIEVDAYGHILKELSYTESIQGEDLNLSLNIKAQDLIYNLVGDKDASVVVMNAKTGEVLALCSTPGFDPNKFTQGISGDYWNKLIKNTHHPLLNKTISQQYPPGSIFKVIAAIAAVENGIDPNMRVECTGSVMVGNHKFHCWRHEGHGALNLAQAIQHSCNPYFYHIAKKVSFDKIADVARKLGFGSKTNLGIIGEVNGILPNREWKRKKLKQEWHLGDSINCIIGHGYTAVTPMQLAVVAARIASGKKISPTLLSTDKEEIEDLDISKEALEIGRLGMTMVVNKEGGTLFRFKVDNPNIAFAAKTGTGQVVSIKHDAKGKALNENSTWETTHHGLSIGFAPIHDPKYVCATVIEHVGSGAGSIPTLKEVLLKIQQFDS